MKKFKVVCVWSMAGIFEVEADSLASAIDKVESAEKPYDKTPDNGVFVDDSFIVDENATIDQNPEEQEDEYLSAIDDLMDDA